MLDGSTLISALDSKDFHQLNVMALLQSGMLISLHNMM